MTGQELAERIEEVKACRRTGYYVAALEWEVKLWQDIARGALGTAYESLAVGGDVAKVLHDQRLAYRELV